MEQNEIIVPILKAIHDLRDEVRENRQEIKEMNSFKGNISFFKGWLNFSSLKVLELLPAKARHNFFEILKLYIKLYIVQAEKQTMMPQAV